MEKHSTEIYYDVYVTTHEYLGLRMIMIKVVHSYQIECLNTSQHRIHDGLLNHISIINCLGYSNIYYISI